MQRPDQYKGTVVDTTIQAWAFDLAWEAVCSSYNSGIKTQHDAGIQGWVDSSCAEQGHAFSVGRAQVVVAATAAAPQHGCDIDL
jgi:hypothetical protein